MQTPMLRPPLEAVIFGFERIGMIIRIAWFPILLCISLYLTAFVSLTGVSMSGGFDVASLDSPEAADEMFSALFTDPGFFTFHFLSATILPILAALIFSCVHVAVTRASTLAEYEPPKLPFYFALGSRELRYFVVKLLYGILITFSAPVFFGLGIGVFAIVFALHNGVMDEPNLLIIAPAVAVVIWLAIVWLWLVLRFLPVLPIAAVENRIAFGDAWAMTKGNFWRIVVSGIFFITLVYAMTTALSLIIIAPVALILGLIGAFAAGFVGAGGFLVLGLLVILSIPLFIMIGSFLLAAEAAYPARLYAYLSGCGDDCKIY